MWKQVLDYFDSFLIGLTATPDKRTFAFFNENVVSEYSHEEAVADGVNVGFEAYTIETEITQQGAKINAKEFVDKRERLTRRKRWEQLDEDYDYTAKELDKDVVNPSQIRNIIKTFKDKLTEIFPGRTEVPKTLVFAKSDSHADDIIQIVREEFNEENAFCKKVTYNSDEDPKSLLAQFRNDYNPRIAVTVDMIATGTDVKPLECLLFMRDVKSRNYFEQMKGRGTRTIGFDDLKKVTPSVHSAKTHFVIVDAVGVTKSLKTDSRPLERKKSVPMKDLVNAVMMGSKEEDIFLTLASRLARLEKQVTNDEKEKFNELSGGITINKIVHSLLDAFNPDTIEGKIRENNPELTEPYSDEVAKEAQDELIKSASSNFTGELNKYIENVRKVHEQVIDNTNIDVVKHAGWDKDAKTKSENLINEFKVYLENNKDELIALNIFYNQPYRIKDITFKMIKGVLDKIKNEKPMFAPLRIWQAYEQLESVNGNSPKNELTVLVSLIRKVSGIDETLTPFDKAVDKNFQNWVFNKQSGALKFNEEQMNWLRMVKEHIAQSFHIEKDDLNYAPFDSKGGVGKMYQLFGDDMTGIIEELNENLAA